MRNEISDNLVEAGYLYSPDFTGTSVGTGGDLKESLLAQEHIRIFPPTVSNTLIVLGITRSHEPGLSTHCEDTAGLNCSCIKYKQMLVYVINCHFQFSLTRMS